MKGQSKKERKTLRERATEDPVVLLLRYASDILSSPLFLREKSFLQHGAYTVYDHSVAVALLCLRFARRSGWRLDLESLARAALLHDYFLYDWHIKPHPKHHANLHPEYASETATRDFGLNELEKEAIRCHMWPFHFFSFPSSKEAWILNICDTHSALKETLRRNWLKKELAILEKRLVPLPQ